MAEINLAPSGANKISSSGKKYNLLALIFSSVLISLTVIGFIFSYSKKYQAKSAFEQSDKKEQVLKKEILDLDPKNTAKLEEKISELSSLLEEHVYWSELFPVIERSTIPTVWYGGLSVVSDKNSIDLEGKAKNLDGAARQIVSLNEEKSFSSVSLKDIGSDSEGTVKLSVSLQFDENLIRKNKAPAKK
ncbi:MAG: hypothetical protein V1804_01655 [Patescibacteria group bacterium]